MATPSYILKRERAHAEMNALRSQAQGWKDGDFYRVSEEHDPHTDEIVVRFDLLQPIPESWSVDFGVYLYLLRSALDNLLYDLLVRYGESNVTDWHRTVIEFPIVATPAALAHKIATFPAKKGETISALNLLFNAAPGVKAVVERVQPYKGKDSLGNELPFEKTTLGVFSLLSNVDKHRTLNAIGASGRINAYAFEGSVHGTVVLTPNAPLDDGAELARFSFGESTSEEVSELKADLAVEVTLADAWVGPGHSVENVLVFLYKGINSILSDLETFL